MPKFYSNQYDLVELAEGKLAEAIALLEQAIENETKAPCPQTEIYSPILKELKWKKAQLVDLGMALTEMAMSESMFEI